MLAFVLPASAAEVEWLKATRSKGHIFVDSEIHIDAPRTRVYDALLEYEEYAELSDSFTVSRYIEPAEDGSPRIYTRIDGCILFFCRTIERYARLELQPQKQIRAIAEPELSDVDFAVETWALSDMGDATMIRYTHELKPNFWVPPLIGVWVIRRTMRSSALDAAIIIEELAGREAGPADTEL